MIPTPRSVFILKELAERYCFQQKPSAKTTFLTITRWRTEAKSPFGNASISPVAHDHFSSFPLESWWKQAEKIQKAPSERTVSMVFRFPVFSYYNQFLLYEMILSYFITLDIQLDPHITPTLLQS